MTIKLQAHAHVTDFGWALRALKGGQRVTRIGWQGPTIWVVLWEGYPEGVPVGSSMAAAVGLPEGTVVMFNPYLLQCNPDGSYQPWTPSVPDVLAEDWMVKSKGIL